MGWALGLTWWQWRSLNGENRERWHSRMQGSNHTGISLCFQMKYELQLCNAHAYLYSCRCTCSYMYNTFTHVFSYAHIYSVILPRLFKYICIMCIHEHAFVHVHMHVCADMSPVTTAHGYLGPFSAPSRPNTCPRSNSKVKYSKVKYR